MSSINESTQKQYGDTMILQCYSSNNETLNIESWLEKMSLSGWHLQKRRAYERYEFKKGDPKFYSYSVRYTNENDYKRNQSNYGEPVHQPQTFNSGTRMDYWIFKEEREQTDDERFDRAYQNAKSLRQLTIVSLIFSSILLALSILSLYQNSFDPSRLTFNPILNLAIASNIVMLIMEIVNTFKLSAKLKSLEFMKLNKIDI